MKKIMFFLFTAVMLLTGVGCQSLVMQTGRYSVKGAKPTGEFACAYKDQIFLRILAPDNQMGALTYWEWAGKYSIDPQLHKVNLDFKDKEFAYRWNFSYELYAGRGCFVLFDLRQNRKRYLIYEKPSLRFQPENVPQAVGSDGVDPVYQPMLPVEQK